MSTNLSTANAADLPAWVPEGALHYLAHTERGTSIRALARTAGCHASTVLRQIRKVEMRRDDPLVDGALRKLGALPQKAQCGPPSGPAHSPEAFPRAAIPDEDTLNREATRVLRRLCENGAVLAVAENLDKAVVVREVTVGVPTRTAVVETAIAQAMALKDWIMPINEGRVTRYQITGTGRTALTAFLEAFGEPVDADAPADADRAADPDVSAQGTGRARFGVGESPLSVLARHRDKSGKRFLDESLVQAGERLREDFELAQMDPRVTQNWDQFLTPGVKTASVSAPALGGKPADARRRVEAALADLGPGLADVALRCCCYLEGLETTEKRLGWSARSGKIVLRIALIRLKKHFDETVGPGGPLIG